MTIETIKLTAEWSFCVRGAVQIVDALRVAHKYAMPFFGTLTRS
jgi:hypothetical protein